MTDLLRSPNRPTSPSAAPVDEQRYRADPGQRRQMDLVVEGVLDADRDPVAAPHSAVPGERRPGLGQFVELPQIEFRLRHTVDIHDRAIGHKAGQIRMRTEFERLSPRIPAAHGRVFVSTPAGVLIEHGSRRERHVHLTLVGCRDTRGEGARHVGDDGRRRHVTDVTTRTSR
ncbi:MULTISPECIES: hypothetical protein [Streptomyces]|uniref:hypothetical protein n=1 Tax=Streptomyces TaxID=1883 RepID=UPI000F746565|nr:MULTISPECIES: hypothetical protein [Streptomyces]RSS03537.1 hypothetical protein EF917_12990 [Streptomyces sp. WAC00469]WTD46267.1 hypothetical protein OG899_01325 [Streptomyces thermoviolaceus]